MKTVTIFGGGGFIGRALTRLLLEKNWKVRIVVRHPDRILPVFKKSPSLELMYGDITEPSTLPNTLKGSNAAINLVGILFESGKQSFERCHLQGAIHVAQASLDAQVPRLIHMSALGADPKSLSQYARTKGNAELALKALRQDVTFMRPSIVFGPEDHFFNRFREMARFSPFLPLVGGGNTRFQPVFVGDVAQSFLRALEDPQTQGKTYTLGGPKIYTFKELLVYMLEVCHLKRWLIPIPYPIASLLGYGAQILPHPPLTPDQIILLQHDNVVPPRAKTLQSLDIKASPLEDIVPGYLR